MLENGPPSEDMAGMTAVLAHGLGNRFVILDARGRSKLHLNEASARALARRYTADQILIVEDAPQVDAAMAVINADGSRAEACGNGTRAAARFLMAEGGQRAVTIAVGKQILSAEEGSAGLGSAGLVSVEMGRARIVPPRPLASANVFGLGPGSFVDVGNPHWVIEVPDAASAPVTTAGPVIERAPEFPNRINVGFAERTGPDSLRLRVWERGAGETLACGTGACAAAAAFHTRALVGSPVRVALAGGDLVIDVSEAGAITMTGPAVLEERITL